MNHRYLPAILAATRRTAARTATTRTPRIAGLICTGLVCAALAACSSPPPPAFNPGGPASTVPATPMAQSSGPGSVVMPPFGKNARIVMTDYLPKDAEMARAVVADKDYELAFLYAEYTGGQSQDWAAYVNHTMEIQVRARLAKPDVTTESFKGTIRIFAMRVIRDPTVPGNLDVSACFDNAKAASPAMATRVPHPVSFLTACTPSPAGSRRSGSSRPPTTGRSRT